MGRRNMCNKATSKNNLEKECDVLMNITLFVLNEKKIISLTGTWLFQRLCQKLKKPLAR